MGLRINAVSPVLVLLLSPPFLACLQVWHGARELFSTSTTDWNDLRCVQAKCSVHSLDEYDRLGCISPTDFYSRFTYDPGPGQFRPDVIPVYCVCELPYNPDKNMVMCEACK